MRVGSKTKKKIPYPCCYSPAPTPLIDFPLCQLFLSLVDPLPTTTTKSKTPFFLLIYPPTKPKSQKQTLITKLPNISSLTQLESIQHHTSHKKKAFSRTQTRRDLMSNYKFRLSDMIPNAWFYKLKDIGKRRKHTTATPSKKKKQSSSKPHQINPRKSYHFTRDLNPNPNPKPNNSSFEPTRQSSKHKTRKRRTTSASSSSVSVSVSVSAGCSCRTKEEHSSSPFHSSTTETESLDPELRTDRVLIPIESSFDEMLSLSTSFDDIVSDMDKNSLVRKDNKLEERYEPEYGCEYVDTFSKLQLAPIRTKKKQHKPKKEEKQKQRSPGVKLRVKSPRIITPNYGNKKSGSRSGYQRSISGSLAIVKSSFDPQKDFRESMVEMIVENNIRTSKDMEDLLACYLSLNSDEYHGVIIKVFKQIWFDLTQIS